VNTRSFRRLVGPTATAYFILSWVIAGALRDGYDPTRDAISRLAEQGAANRWIVTSGIVVFGIGAVIFAPLLKWPAMISLVVAGVASIGVASFPCSQGCPGSGTSTDLLHAGFATLFYISFTVTPVLQSRSRFSAVVSVVAAVALSLHGLGIANGLMQRIGLTTLDAWLIFVGLTGRELVLADAGSTGERHQALRY
jgi:hypothetical membrane protein